MSGISSWASTGLTQRTSPSTPRPWVHPLADHPGSPGPQPGLLEHLPHRGVLRQLVRLDLAARERPRRNPVPAPTDQHAQAAGDHGYGHRGPRRQFPSPIPGSRASLCLKLSLITAEDVPYSLATRIASSSAS